MLICAARPIGRAGRWPRRAILLFHQPIGECASLALTGFGSVPQKNRRLWSSQFPRSGRGRTMPSAAVSRGTFGPSGTCRCTRSPGNRARSPSSAPRRRLSPTGLSPISLPRKSDRRADAGGASPLRIGDRLPVGAPQRSNATLFARPLRRLPCCVRRSAFPRPAPDPRASGREAPPARPPLPQACGS